MNFCEDCDNMLYVKINEDHVLEYYCKTCSRTYKPNVNESQCVYLEDYNTDTIKKESLVNKYTFDDPTLPFAKGIKCPNDKCSSKKANIKYMNYDNKGMKYMYVCMDCRKDGIEPYTF